MIHENPKKTTLNHSIFLQMLVLISNPRESDAGFIQLLKRRKRLYHYHPYAPHHYSYHQLSLLYILPTKESQTWPHLCLQTPSTAAGISICKPTTTRYKTTKKSGMALLFPGLHHESSISRTSSVQMK